MIGKKLFLCSLSLTVALSGCATSGANYRPMVDTKGLGVFGISSVCMLAQARADG